MRGRAETTTLDRDGEAALLTRLRAGEQAAYEELTRRHGGRMLAVARRLLRHEEEAEDAVQEAFLAAWRALPRFEGQSRLGTWLHRIVVNAALMRLRARRRRPEAAIEDLLPHFDETGHRIEDAPPLPAADTELARAQLCAAVRRCIDRLPESHRTVILLRDVEELDTREVATLLGISEAAAKVRLHRARQALRTLLVRERIGAGEELAPEPVAPASQPPQIPARGQWAMAGV